SMRCAVLSWCLVAAGRRNRGEIIASLTGVSVTGTDDPVIITRLAVSRVSPPYHWPVNRLTGEQPLYSTRYAPLGSPLMTTCPSGFVCALRVASGLVATTQTLASGAPSGPRTSPTMEPR